MSTPIFVETHNLVAFLEKPSEFEGFKQIIDFLNAKPIRYDLTVNPTIYASCVKQFWTTTKVKNVNDQEQIQALVDKQKVIITEESIRHNLKFNDAEGTTCLPNDTIFEELARMSEILVKESILTPSNDPLPSGKNSIQLNELMIFYTNLQQQVLDLEEAKIAQAKEIAKLKKRIKKLEKRRKSRPVGLRRLKEGRSIEDIDQDAKIALVDEAQGRMYDADMFGFDDLEGNEVFVDVREQTVKKEVSTADLVTTGGEVVTTASIEVSVAPTTATTADVDDELTLAKTLIEIKETKPNVISTAITTPKAKEFKSLYAKSPSLSWTINHLRVNANMWIDLSGLTNPVCVSRIGKVKMIEAEKTLKNKDQIALDEEVARKLEAKMRAEMEEEEERIAKEKDEANRVVIEE
nr:xylulose kinase-1 [Tanacetum cinerariifolium]